MPPDDAASDRRVDLPESVATPTIDQIWAQLVSVCYLFCYFCALFLVLTLKIRCALLAESRWAT